MIQDGSGGAGSDVVTPAARLMAASSVANHENAIPASVFGAAWLGRKRA